MLIDEGCGFPTDPSKVANYVFAHDQVGMKDLRIIVDGRVPGVADGEEWPSALNVIRYVA
jgi:hypothetical protein